MTEEQFNRLKKFLDNNETFQANLKAFDIEMDCYEMAVDAGCHYKWAQEMVGWNIIDITGYKRMYFPNGF